MEFIQKHQLKTKEILAFLRLALSGQMQGTSVFEMMAIFAKTETLRRLKNFANHLGNA